MTALARITIYPIKSLGGIDVSETEVLPASALRGDRRWAIVGGDGRFVNGKRTAAIQTIRAEFTSNLRAVTLSCLTIPSTKFQLADECSAIGEWLSDALQIPCKLVENRETGFPDDLEASGPTLVSASTLEEVARWFSLSPDEVRRRFRANLVIDPAEPFWEDRLVGEVDSPVPFTLGEVGWLGVNPCQRCVVPARDSHTGQATPRFQGEFASRRESTLPAWAPRQRFDHFYRLTVNTRLANGASSRLRLGDKLCIKA